MKQNRPEMYDLAEHKHYFDEDFQDYGQDLDEEPEQNCTEVPGQNITDYCRSQTVSFFFATLPIAIALLRTFMYMVFTVCILNETLLRNPPKIRVKTRKFIFWASFWYIALSSCFGLTFQRYAIQSVDQLFYKKLIFAGFLTFFILEGFFIQEIFYKRLICNWIERLKVENLRFRRLRTRTINGA